jgi:hypothetical protein
MTVSIVNNSARIVVTRQPTTNHPAIFASKMSFTSNYIAATGEVKLNCAPGDNASGWTAGFIQAQWIETNWCSYRGRNNSDGSIFLQRGRPPARATQACRDCVNSVPVNGIFYSTAATTTGGPAGMTNTQTLRFDFSDQPADSCNLIETNSLTGQPNYLAEAQFEFLFCTVLSVRDPSGAFHHLASFYWNVRWQAKFKPLTFGAVPAFQIMSLSAGTGAGTGPVIRGTPTDKRFTGVLTSPQHQSCNQVFQAATAATTVPSAQNRHESPIWTSFNVRQP